MSDAGIDKAVEAIGSKSNLAKALKVSRGAISLWKKIPPLRVLRVELLTGVPRHELRPDLYPPPQKIGRRDRRRSRLPGLAEPDRVGAIRAARSTRAAARM